jgi:hypothetical protein
MGAEGKKRFCLLKMRKRDIESKGNKTISSEKLLNMQKSTASCPGMDESLNNTSQIHSTRPQGAQMGMRINIYLYICMYI